MPAAAWVLGITYPQSIKRLGHFLTADNISAGTPNGGQDISGAGARLAEDGHIRRYGAGTPNGGQDISGAGGRLAEDGHIRRYGAGTPNGGQDISGAGGRLAEDGHIRRYGGGFVIPYPITMPATAWLLGIANPQSIKRLGHFLTADCKSAGTPNGGKAYPALRKAI